MKLKTSIWSKNSIKFLLFPETTKRTVEITIEQVEEVAMRFIHEAQRASI
jgi:hypothetical protein